MQNAITSKETFQVWVQTLTTEQQQAAKLVVYMSGWYTQEWRRSLACVVAVDYDDIFQTCCEACLEAMETYDSKRNISLFYWVRDSIRNSLTNVVRRKYLRPQERVQLLLSELVGTSNEPCAEMEMEDAFIEAEAMFNATTQAKRWEAVQKYWKAFLCQLPARDQEIIRHRFAGMQETQIAGQLHISQSTVSRRLAAILEHYEAYKEAAFSYRKEVAV